MFKLFKRKNRKERTWEILKEHNPELTRERFDAAYDELMNHAVKILAETQR